MDSEIWEDEIECSCTRFCLCKYSNSDKIQNVCLRADYIFEELDHVIKLKADLKKGIELRRLSGKTFRKGGSDFFQYRMVAIITAYDLVLDIEKCTGARKIIKDTDYEKIYFEAKEKYSEAIDKLMKIRVQDIQQLQKDRHHEIDL